MCGVAGGVLNWTPPVGITLASLTLHDLLDFSNQSRTEILLPNARLTGPELDRVDDGLDEGEVARLHAITETGSGRPWSAALMKAGTTAA